MNPFSIIISSFFILLSFTVNSQTATSLFNQAEKQRKAESYKEALKLYNKAIELGHDSARFYSGRSETYLHLGMAPEAFKDINTVIQLQPKDPMSYLLRGQFFYMAENMDKAILDYNQMLVYATADSAKVMAYTNLSSCKMHKRDFKGGAEDCRKGLKIDSLNSGLLNNLAMSLDEIGQGDEALKILKKIVTIDSTLEYAYMNLGFYLTQKERYRESLPYFDKAIKMEPKDMYAWNNRGYAKLKLNDYEGALSDINQSIKGNPNNSYAFRNRALVYKAMGKKKKACEDWEQALKLNFTAQYGKEVEESLKNECY